MAGHKYELSPQTKQESHSPQPSAGLWKNQIIFSELPFIKANLRNYCVFFADGENLKKKM